MRRWDGRAGESPNGLHGRRRQLGASASHRLGPVEPEITPEPSPAERAAILAALKDQNADDGAPPACRSLWRRDGIRESVEDEDKSY